MELREKFALRLKELREETDLTQKQLGDILGVSRGSISFYENRDRVADIEFLQKASGHFGVSYDYLLGNSDIRNETEQKRVSDMVERTLKQIGLEKGRFKEINPLEIMAVYNTLGDLLVRVCAIKAQDGFHNEVSGLIRAVMRSLIVLFKRSAEHIEERSVQKGDYVALEALLGDIFSTMQACSHGIDNNVTHIANHICKTVAPFYPMGRESATYTRRR